MSISWVITKDTSTNIVRYESTNANVVDLNQVIIGDYVNIFGTGFNANNRGSFTLTNVEVYYSGGNLIQAFELFNPDGFAETATQSLNSDVQFFRPNKFTTQTTNNRTVVVSSTQDGILNISIPATTQIVNRTIKTGSYLHVNDSLVVNKIFRDKNGLVTVKYNGSASLSIGDYVYLDNIQSGTSVFVDNGVPGTYPANGTTDASSIDNVTLLQQQGSEPGRKNYATIKSIDGQALTIGGHKRVASTPTATDAIALFKSISQATISDGTLADGLTRYTYQLPALGSDTDNADLPTASNITSGPSIGQVMIAGGDLIPLDNWSAVELYKTNTYKYDPLTNTTMTSGTMPAAWLGQTQLTLSDGRILVYGGAKANSSNNMTGLNTGDGYLWDANTQAWSVSADFTTSKTRANHSAVQMNNGKVLFTGGAAGAISHPADTYTLALWRLDETGGTTINDSSGNSYNLTTTGTTIPVIAKINNGREFTQAGAFANGAGNAGAVTALLGEWTVEWWSCGATGTYPGAMVLSGLGSGTIVAYGDTGGVAPANNTLMHVSISGGNLVWRWENAGTATGSAAITGALTDHFNHFAVRKKFNGTNYDVQMFVNGKSIGINTNQSNATGGTTSQWFMAKNPDGADSFSGIIDDVRVSNIARTDLEILLDFFNGSANVQVPTRNHRIGKLQGECETWDPNTTIVAQVGSMALGRCYHTSDLLPDGRVIVIGGLAHNPTNFARDLSISGGNSLFGPSASTNICEIFDSNTNKWELGPVAGIRRHKHSTVYVPERNAIFVIGGESTQSDDVLVVEVLDLNTMKFKPLANSLSHTAGGAVLMDNGNIFVASSEVNGAQYFKQNQLITLESPTVSSGGLNGFFRISATGSNSFGFETPNNKSFTSNFDETNFNSISTASRSSNVTTITFTAPGHNFGVGDFVYVNFQGNPSQFGSGVKTITAVSSDTISYAETASNQSVLSETGSVFKDVAPDAIFTTWKAVSTNIPGPYILDPANGISVTDIDSVTASILNKNQKYAKLDVADATVFPDEEGFIVIGFGTNIQTMPIKYFGRFSSTDLLIDYNYTFINDIPIGTEVMLLSQREPFVPTELFGGMYATASSAGRIAAENTINDIAAAGINVNTTVVYPGTKGLPDKDKTFIWGGDE